MGLINEHDRRPRDWAYRAAFDRKDLPSLQDMAKHIRETHDTDMIEEINTGCERKLGGERTELSNGLEIQQVTKTEDIVLNVGLQQCINIILGTSTARWTRFGFTRNSGASQPSVTQTALDVTGGGGPWYVSLATYGWNEPKGMKLFFGTITPQDTTDPNFKETTINEMGISNVNNVLLNREMFFNNAVSRTMTSDGEMFKQVFMFSCVIEFVPVAY